MNKYGNITIGKISDSGTIEDCSRSSKNMIAVCDGAGGCGIFTDEWSKYLINNLNDNKPIKSYTQLCQWIDGIWEPFFDKKQSEINSADSFVQNKFYDEGSYSTLAAMWRCGPKRKMIYWCTFGDTACFAYSNTTGKLTLLSHKIVQEYHSNPNLINWKSIPSTKGFRSGKTMARKNTVFFIVSDALAYYITMAYELTKGKNNIDHTALINIALKIKEKGINNFSKNIIKPLMHSTKSEECFTSHIKQLYESGRINNDDYSISWIKI